MIVLEDVTKDFEGRRVLDRVSLRFERGEMTALVGPSGGGKSTLLRCINGLERFESGRIVAFGIELGPKRRGTEERAARAAMHDIRLKVGMVFQGYGLFGHMTALENVMEAPVHVKHIPPGEARVRAEALLEQVGLTHRRQAYPREMSGGEQQRVAIARALAMDPEALLLDEPTSALDPERKLEVMRVLAQLRAAHTTMILVTHDAALVRDLVDRTVVLRDGRVSDL